MSTIVHALTETNGQTGFVIAVFFDEARALEIAQSHAEARMGRCLAADARLQGGTTDPDAYAIRVEYVGTGADVTIVHVASGELDDCRWSIRKHTVVPPAAGPAQAFGILAGSTELGVPAELGLS